MKKPITKQFFKSVKMAQGCLKKFTPKQKAQLERSWDIEHAYYSSTLEGSKLDKKEFEKLAEQVQ